MNFVGGVGTPPFVTVIISLCEDGDPNSILANMVESADDHIVTSCDRNITFLRYAVDSVSVRLRNLYGH